MISRRANGFERRFAISDFRYLISDCSVESIMFSADSIVIPQSAPCTAHDAKAGIQNPAQNVDSRFRGNDDDAASKSQAAMFSTEHFLIERHRATSPL
jgi:hypothetical protein